jgi:hypothetical protein
LIKKWINLRLYLVFSCLASLVHVYGSNVARGTPPAARAGCGFAAVGSRLFVFAGASKLTKYKGVIGENHKPFST